MSKVLYNKTTKEALCWTSLLAEDPRFVTLEYSDYYRMKRGVVTIEELTGCAVVVDRNVQQIVNDAAVPTVQISVDVKREKPVYNRKKDMRFINENPDFRDALDSTPNERLSEFAASHGVSVNCDPPQGCNEVDLEDFYCEVRKQIVLKVRLAEHRKKRASEHAKKKLENARERGMEVI